MHQFTVTECFNLVLYRVLGVDFFLENLMSGMISHASHDFVLFIMLT